MNERIRKYVDGVGQKIEDRAVKLFDIYVQKAVESVVDYETKTPGYEIPRVGILDPDYQADVRCVIRGVLTVEEGSVLGNIARNQIDKVIAEHIKRR